MPLKGCSAPACGVPFLIPSVYCWHTLCSFNLSVIGGWGQEEESWRFLSLVAGSRAEPTHDPTALSKRGRGCLPATLVLLQPLHRVTPLWQSSLGAHACRWPAVGTGRLMPALQGRLFRCARLLTGVSSWAGCLGDPRVPLLPFSPLLGHCQRRLGLVAPPCPIPRVAAGAMLLLATHPERRAASSSSPLPASLTNATGMRQDEASGFLFKFSLLFWLLE